MIYTLFLWTAVVYQSNNVVVHDWRPMGEFHDTTFQARGGAMGDSGRDLCERAARELNIEQRYRCVRSK